MPGASGRAKDAQLQVIGALQATADGAFEEQRKCALKLGAIFRLTPAFDDRQPKNGCSTV
jgi:hypothetical protein